MTAVIRKRSKVAKRAVGGVRTVIVKLLNGVYQIDVPDRKEYGNYFQKLRDMPAADVQAMIECIEEVRDEGPTS